VIAQKLWRVIAGGLEAINSKRRIRASLAFVFLSGTRQFLRPPTYEAENHLPARRRCFFNPLASCR
jgi:hypothetical protein